ncbi:hypothetical protein ACPCSE_29525 [Streptomyces cellulosae]
MSIPLKARVQLDIDGHVYQPGEWVSLPDGQEERARQLLAYGYADEAPAQPVKPKTRRSASRR